MGFLPPRKSPARPAPEFSAPIVGVTKPSHLEGALKALDVTLDAEAITALQERYIAHEKSR
jgi:aryl-alcohol dehydrogenase-like predicted oxidoreductase